MASFATTSVGRRSFFLLPSHLRSIVYQSPRSFSSSAARKSVLADAAVAGPNALINGVHSLGVPWYAAIPLTAVFVRSTIVYYLSTRPARRAATFRNQIAPLANAHVGADIFLTSPPSVRQEVGLDKVEAFSRRISIAFKRLTTLQRMSRHFGLKATRLNGLVNFGFLITFAETIRLKCGAREGLLSLVLSPFEWVGRRIVPAQFPQIVSKDPAEVIAERLGLKRDQMAASTSTTAQNGDSWTVETWSADRSHQGLEQSSSQAIPAAPTSLNTPDTSSVYYDPSLQTEGLSWCTDLTLPDPTMTLPLTLAAVMALSSLLRPRSFTQSFQAPAKIDSPLALISAIAAPVRDWIRKLSFSQRLGICVAIYFGYVSMGMPTAILLYLIPSIGTGWLQNRYLDIKYPVYPPIQPCKRPMRQKVRRGWT